jgi:hypothetical protein
VVGIVAIEVLYLTGTRGTLPLSRARMSVGSIAAIAELEEFESATVGIEVVVNVAGHHAGSLTAVVHILAVRTQSVLVESILQVDRGTAPATPAVAILIEAFDGEVAVE